MSKEITTNLQYRVGSGRRKDVPQVKQGKGNDPKKGCKCGKACRAGHGCLLVNISKPMKLFA
jgi:hypothetical protein